MKIRFPIMWIDDNDGFFDSLKDEVEELISDHGLKADICFHKDVAGLLDKIPLCNPYLIIVDYKLGGGMTGDRFIIELRERGHFHDVLFYTQAGFSVEDFKTFFSSPNSALASGVNFCPKNATKDRLEEIVNLKLLQVSDLPTQRGWIIADIIELECILDDLLLKLSHRITPVFQGTIERVLDNKQRADFGYKDALLNGMLKDLISHLRTVQESSALVEKLFEIKKIMSDFSFQIIEVRNSIAHQQHTVNGCGTIEIAAIQKKREPISYNQTFLKKIREDIQKHFRNFSNLNRAIDELGDLNAKTKAAQQGVPA